MLFTMVMFSQAEWSHAQKKKGRDEVVPVRPVIVDPAILDPIAVENCSAYNGQSEEFDFRDEPNESMGVCQAAWEKTDPEGDGVMEALDLLLASGRFNSWNDISGKPAGIRMSPAGTKSCQCLAKPIPKEMMSGFPEFFEGQFVSTRNCGVRRGDWLFDSCEPIKSVDPDIGGSCPSFRLLKQSSGGPGGVRTQVFGLNGYADPTDVFGLTVYGHQVMSTGFKEMSSHAKWLTELVNRTSPEQWNSAGLAPFGANGFPPRINPVFNTPDSAMLYLELDDANQAMPWIRSTARPECSTGGCPVFSSTYNAVEGDRRIQTFNLSGMFEAGDAVGFKIYGYEVYVKYEPGMSNAELMKLLAERIMSISPKEWAYMTGQQSLMERMHRYPIEISLDSSQVTAARKATYVEPVAVKDSVAELATPIDAIDTTVAIEGSDSTTVSIKMVLDPAQLAIPIVITTKGACKKIPPFAFKPAEGSLGVIDQGSSSSMGVAVYNVSGRTIKECSLFVSDPENFQIKSGPECDGFAAGGACKFELIASPAYSAFGSVVANVYIACGNDLAMSDVAGYRFEVGAIQSPPELYVKPLTLDFGFVKVGSASQIQNMTLVNGGGQRAQDCKVSLDNAEDFVIKNPEACTQIGGGEGCSLDLVAVPKSEGPRKATLFVQCSNAQGQSTVDGIMVNFSAMTPTPSPAMTPSPMALLSFTTPSTADFGTVSVGSAGGPMSLTVVNSGTLDASLCKLSFSGPDAAQFQFDSTCTSVPASTCQSVCQKGCPVGDVCGYDVKLSCCMNYSNPEAAMECPLCKPGSCTFSMTGRPTVAGSMKSHVTLSCGTGGSAISTTNGITMNATDPGGSPTPTATPSCTMEGAVKISNGSCVCPSGYEVANNAAGAQVCRPSLHSNEFARAADSFSDGYPVCGKGRMPLTQNFFLSDISTQSRPLTSFTTLKLGNSYPFAKDNSGDSSTVLPQYLYSAAALKRCVCSSSDVAYDPSTTSISTGRVFSGSGRFVSDLYEVISAASTSNPNPDTYGAVPIAHDASGGQNGYLGSVYYPGHGGSGVAAATCGCPNLNEKATPVSAVSGSGYSCSPALDTSDATTRKYLVLANYDPSVHASGTHLIDPSSPTAKVTRIQLPTASGSYRNYNRRIWTCAPPTYLDVASKTCKIKEDLHMCDNGSTSGVASPVSPNLSGFDHAANPKLACCLNSFDRKNPSSPLKYDCIQSADQSPADFEKLWMSNDPVETGGQSHAMVLTDGSGRPVTGFFTLTGARCGEYSEFAGPIREATVNPAQIASQQTLSGNKMDQNFIQFSGNVIGPPSGVPSWYASKKTVPDQTARPAQAARECPILSRAALVVTCGTDDSPGKLPEQFTDSKGNVHCLAAKTIRVHLRIQQVYKITGMAPIKTFDTVLDIEEAKRSGINIEGMIRARAGTYCPAGSSYVEGSCLFK